MSPTIPPPNGGTPFGSRYVLLDEIGRGGMGVVHRAVRRDGGPELAVKLLREDLADQSAMLERFLREADLIRSVRHPNVVQVHDIVVDGGRIGVVMDLLPLGDLRRNLRPPVPLAQVVRLGAQIAAGLAAVHAAGIVHRDVKPENILIASGGEQPQVRLSDFGISRLVGTTGTLSNVLGTPRYMAPEVFRGHPGAPASDVYALGVMLTEWLTGRRLFDAESPYALMRAHIDDVPELPPDLPPGLAGLLAAMLAKPATERPTATDVATRLSGDLTGTRSITPSLPGTATESTPPGVPGAGRGSSAHEQGGDLYDQRSTGGRLSRRQVLIGAGGVLAILGAGAASRFAGRSGDSTVPAAARNLVRIGVELPRQGSGADASEGITRALNWYLQSVRNRAGEYSVQLTEYDSGDASADDAGQAACTANAAKHVAAQGEVAVIGAATAGCARALVPVLNLAPGAPMLLVSHNTTDPGLTGAWAPGEPGRYQPSGRPGFARVVGTDADHGTVAARYGFQRLNASRAFVLHDDQTFGRGVAQAFRDEATRLGITVLGSRWWGPEAGLNAVLARIAALRPELILLAGQGTSQAAALLQAKIKALGPNSDSVAVMAPQSLAGDITRTAALPGATGMHLTAAGLGVDDLFAVGGGAARFLNDYRKANGSPLTTSTPVYAVAALQVVLEAIARSDGTRAGVTKVVFGDPAITVPAEQSVLGIEFSIDPATGDITTPQFSVITVGEGGTTALTANATLTP